MEVPARIVDEMEAALLSADPDQVRTIIRQNPQVCFGVQKGQFGDPLWKLALVSGASLGSSGLARHRECFSLLAKTGLRLSQRTAKGLCLLTELTHAHPDFTAALLKELPRGPSRIESRLGSVDADTRAWWSRQVSSFREDEMNARLPPAKPASRPNRV